MNRILLILLLIIGLGFTIISVSIADSGSPRNVLILVEGNTDLKNYAMGDGRQLATLFGHFNVHFVLKGVDEYVTGEMKQFDQIYYLGFHAKNTVPRSFAQDVLDLGKRVFWINTGFEELSKTYPVARQFGFEVRQVDSLSRFERVRFGDRVFNKGEPNINSVTITNGKKVSILATATSERHQMEVPYIITSGNLTYIADSPFAGAAEADRYILFADLLHDFLGEEHEESHSAIIRIEDVGLFDDPNQLREIADLLSSKEIPFVVGVIPFYVDPGQGIRISLSDKPDLVDALKYMVKNGATLEMHGVTHQYKGVTAGDFEFWDATANMPIKHESADEIARKLEMGIQEFMKNGLYPLLWETPHYTGSFALYQTVAKFFSTAMEQRLSLEDADYGQTFPYIIHNDLFGQRIIPENLGYVPLDPDKKTSETYVQNIIRNARANLAVRDGFASCFFHSFLDLDLLKQLVEGVQRLGYTYVNVSEETHWVKSKDRVILSGSQSYQITLQDQYLAEAYFDARGEVIRRTTSDVRLRGPVSREIELSPGEIYKAEPIEFRPREMGFVSKVVSTANRAISSMLFAEPEWHDARAVILWNHYARGGAYNDQASFASVFASVHINVDTIFVGQRLRLSQYNLVIAPFAFIDSLAPSDYDELVRFVNEGGNLITDQKSELAQELGIHFSTSQLQLREVRDLMYPEEPIVWPHFEPMNKLNVENIDEVFCQDAATDAPVVIGMTAGKGKIIFFATMFDPFSQQGYSRYPFLLDYVKRYFLLGPIVRRENLEAFFEPGLRANRSIEDLVKLWVRAGIRRIHVAAWHEYPRYTYDYARLIRLAHANGILVYAWLEPPQVSQKFWMDHPEWQERNYKGESVRPSWRYPVALTESACVDSMTAFYRKLLSGFDWDGVNLAELYFEAGKGLDEPLNYTPMHPSAVREVKRKFGFDLLSVFDESSPWYWKSNPNVRATLTEYRVAKLNEVYEQLLRSFSDFARTRPGFQIIVTAMDSYGAPELKEYIGVEMGHILALQRRFNFFLQVEDAEHLWSTDPRRYIQIGQHYEKLMGGRSKLLLDLNILDLSSSTRKPGVVTPFPTIRQTGTESLQLIQAAAIGAPRFTFYAEQTVNPQDLQFFASAAAHGIRYQRNGTIYSIDADHSFVLRFPKEIAHVLIDGGLVPGSRENLYFIPAGQHIVDVQPGTTSAFSTSQLQPRILSATGEILSLTYGMREAQFAYDSDERMLVTFSNEPTQVFVDGQQYPCTPMKGSDCYTIQLPPGRHQASILTGDTFSYGINVTSLWSTTAIVMFGFLAVVLLAAMYVGLRMVRRRYSH